MCLIVLPVQFLLTVSEGSLVRHFLILRLSEGEVIVTGVLSIILAAVEGRFVIMDTVDSVIFILMVVAMSIESVIHSMHRLIIHLIEPSCDILLASWCKLGWLIISMQVKSRFFCGIYSFIHERIVGCTTRVRVVAMGGLRV